MHILIHHQPSPPPSGQTIAMTMPPHTGQAARSMGLVLVGVITRSQRAHLSQRTHCKQPRHTRCPQLGHWRLDGRAPFAPRRNEKSDHGVAVSFWLSGVKNGGSLIFSDGDHHPQNLRGSIAPANEEAQQEAAKASDKLSCRTRLMGPLFVLGALVAVAQAKPAMARKRTSAERAIGQRSVCWRRDGTIRQGMLAVRARCPGVL
jgi:hypothetical protein